MQLQGAALAGLDEFMLRLGHLTVVAETAMEYGGYLHRVEKKAASKLTELTTVEADDSDLIFYLRQKRLCRIDGKPDDPATGELRYPSINLSTGNPPTLNELDGAPLQVWWQDRCLSEPGVASRVGAVTASARSGSKTGLSHVIDWATSLSLLSPSGEPTAEANLVNWLCRVLQKKENPYILGAERLVYAYLFFRSDIDIISRYCTKLIGLDQPFDKSAAVDAFIEVVGAISDEAATSGTLTARSQFALLQIWRDLAKGTRTGSKGGSRSTAWHRCSSRLETLVDLGLLDKTDESGGRKFEYRYSANERLAMCVRSFAAAEDLDDWIDRFLVEALTEIPADGSLPLRIEECLTSAVESVGTSLGLLPIDTMALSIAASSMYAGRPVSVGQARAAIEGAARSHPGAVRLARGNSGDRAEFASINLRKLHE